MKPCLECGSTERDEEFGEYALLELSQGKLRLDLDSPNNAAVVVRVTVCNKCGYVTLRESR